MGSFEKYITVLPKHKDAEIVLIEREKNEKPAQYKDREWACDQMIKENT